MIQIINYLIRKYYRFRLELFRILSNKQPVPIKIISKLRTNILFNESYGSSLFPRFFLLNRFGRELNDIELRMMLSNVKLGEWSLTVDSINYLVKTILKYDPNTILEMGSGISTLCLATLARRLSNIANKRVNIYSIEQNLNDVKRTNELLDAYNLSDWVKLTHFPLVKQIYNGKEIYCYDMPTEKLDNFLEGNRPDFLLIDGPSGPPGSRLLTLPSVFMWMNQGGIFLMDDALRDAEIEIGKQWNGNSRVRLDGIVMVGKGFLQGRVF